MKTEEAIITIMRHLEQMQTLKIEKFANQIDSKYVYRIPLKYLCNLGKINFPTKLDLKIHCMFQTNMKQLFESKKKVNAIDAPDAQIVLVRAPYLQYEQILLTKNFRQYLEAIMLSSKVLRMRIQKTPHQKMYKLQAGSQEFTVDFKGCDRQFDWIERSLHYDKSNKYLTIYDSDNAEYAARMRKKIDLSNISDTYSATDMMKFDISSSTQKHLLWK